MFKPLKIFIIGPAYPLRGGPAEFNENLCQELNKAGHDAQIISYSLQYPNFLFPGSSQYETSGKAPDGIKIHTLINTVNPFNWFKVARFIKKEKPDFILFRYWLPFFGPSLGTIGKLVKSKTKVLALTDNIIPHEKRFGDKPFTKYFVNNCHGFIAMSKAVLNDISKFSSTSDKIYSPHPMYETYGPAVSMKEARDKLGLNHEDKFVLFFGLIRHYKGLDILLEAMKHPSLEKQNIKLLIAGEFYEDKQPYLDIIASKELKDRVILRDNFIPKEDVRFYFCSSNLVAQTYRNATNSGVTMVGYFYDKPMLVTNVGGLAEIVPDGKCGYLVENSIDKISEKLSEYFEKNKEHEFTGNVKLEKKKYEWSVFINSLLTLYNKC
ncbi:MAG: glycosyl transferase family 1 [Bacteroidetes bacterium]|jgi:glycosyltransferase involved in cell wall biosynthesis|nr:glycosyl transferase family 1 [Bacteroidota bacterium]